MPGREHESLVDLLPRVMRDHFNVQDQAWKNPTPRGGRGEHPDGLGVVNVAQTAVGYDSAEQQVDLRVGDVVIADAKTVDSDRRAHGDKRTRQVRALGDFEVYVTRPGVVNPANLKPHEGLIEIMSDRGDSRVVRWPMRKLRTDVRGAIILLARIAVGRTGTAAGERTPPKARTPKKHTKADEQRMSLLDEHPASASVLAKVARHRGMRGDEFKALKLSKFYDGRDDVKFTLVNGIPHYSRKEAA